MRSNDVDEFRSIRKQMFTKIKSPAGFTAGRDSRKDYEKEMM